MTNLDQLREARMPCFACEGSRSHAIVLPIDEELIDAVIPCEPCQSTGTVLVFRDSLWQFFPWCKTHKAVEPAHRCRDFDDMPHQKTLFPKYYDSDLEAVGPVLRDWAEAIGNYKAKWPKGATPRRHIWASDLIDGYWLKEMIRCCIALGWLKEVEDGA